jgi:hypothetical protein
VRLVVAASSLISMDKCFVVQQLTAIRSGNVISISFILRLCSVIIAALKSNESKNFSMLLSNWKYFDDIYEFVKVHNEPKAILLCAWM